MRRKSERKQTGSAAPLILLWVAFVTLALVVHTTIGCPLGGCRSSMISFLAAIGLAFGLAALMTHSDRVERRKLHPHH